MAFYPITGQMFDMISLSPYCKGLWDTNSLQLLNFMPNRKQDDIEIKLGMNSKNKKAFYLLYRLVEGFEAKQKKKYLPTDFGQPPFTSCMFLIRHFIFIIWNLFLRKFVIYSQESMLESNNEYLLLLWNVF